MRPPKKQIDVKNWQEKWFLPSFIGLDSILWYNPFMNKYLKLLFPMILLSFSNFVLAEKIIIIQSVSDTQKTFVVQLGKKDGINQGQESLFSTEDVSLAARAVEVSRYFSLWELRDKNARIPFLKENFVVFSNSIQNIYSEIPLLKGRFTKAAYVPTHHWIIRMSFSETLSESSSEADDQISATRRGYQIEGMWQKELNKKFSWGVGARMDNEVGLITDPALEIPTTRLFAIAELSYNFPRFEDSKNHIYASVGLGYGTTTSEINRISGTGTAWALPVARIGVQNNNFNSLAWLFEAVFESITSQEIFEDGQQQTTNFINAKFGIGVKF